MKIWSIAGLALIAASAGAAAAQDAPQEKRVDRFVFVGGPGEGMRDGLDANKDGVISREEFAAMNARLFERLDANKDGKLGDDEFGARRGGGPDGPARVVVCRKKAEGDSAAKDVPCDELGGDVVMLHGGRGDGPPRRHGMGPHRRMMMMLHGDGGGLDRNKDGKLTFDELAAPMREHFAELDANKDGALDAKERKAMRGGPGEVRVIERRIEKK